MSLFDQEGKKKRINELNEIMLQADFWSDRRYSKEKIDELNNLKNILDSFDKVKINIDNLVNELEQLRNDYDTEMHLLLEEIYFQVINEVNNFEMLVLLNGPFDNNNAILEFHPGAGGVESHDWADMLYQMYVRFAQRKDFKVEILDYQAGEEAGIKSVTMIIKGANAYGLLRSEQGVHRLVRISPFDSASKRHTSFASVDVIPEIIDNMEITINDDDLKIDTYRASGAGGQHVNKTDSAVRITHLPSSIVVSCQSERSQIQNKDRCMATLKSRLYQKMVEEKNEELNKIRGVQKSVEWGSQIRSYVFCPYTMVKDHRNDFESSDVSKVMNGEIEDFIYAYLKMGVK